VTFYEISRKGSETLIKEGDRNPPNNRKNKGRKNILISPAEGGAYIGESRTKKSPAIGGAID
jgi:hypothetical protein